MEETNSNLVYYETPLLEQIKQLQQENERLNNSINESNLAKINALLKLEKLQQEKEELIKWLEEEITRINKLISPKKSIKAYGTEKYLHENTINRYRDILNKLKGDDKNE